MIHGMYTMLFNFATISPTMVMNTSHLLSIGSVGLFMHEIYQSFGLRDGFIDCPVLSVFQLFPGPILQPFVTTQIRIATGTHTYPPRWANQPI